SAGHIQLRARARDKRYACSWSTTGHRPRHAKTSRAGGAAAPRRSRAAVPWDSFAAAPWDSFAAARAAPDGAPSGPLHARAQAGDAAVGGEAGDVDRVERAGLGVLADDEHLE